LKTFDEFLASKLSQLSRETKRDHQFDIVSVIWSRRMHIRNDS